MTNKPVVTVGKILGAGAKFDPMALDTTEIKELSNAMPKDGNIDVNNAEALATKYLRGADLCGELIAIATAYMSRTKDAKQRAYNQAFLVKSAENKGIKTDKMRVAFAELDDDYQNACEDHNKALAFSKWVESKYSSFNKMHYLCKKILERAYSHEKAAGWNGSPQVADDNESW
jgi:hypothetical protein